jgi:DNA-binding NarL/FixJ family response regulator
MKTTTMRTTAMKTTAKKIRILIADDHSVVRRGLRSLLEAAQGFSIVAECTDGEQVLQMVEKYNPDVVMLDISMPKMNGIETTRILKRQHPDVRVLMLTIHESEEYVYQVIRAGADGYVLKSADKKELWTAVRSVTDGGRFFSPGVSNIIVSQFTNRLRDDRAAGIAGVRSLTPRENEVLRCIAQGKTSRAIAAELLLSIRTVNTHRANLMQKLDIHEKAGLVRYAIQNGIVDLHE